MAGKIDRNAADFDRVQRNFQRLIANGVIYSISTTGGLQLSSGSLSIKLNGASLATAAGGLSLSSANFGDITTATNGTVWTINAAAVTLAKMANLAQDRLIGRQTASTGVPEAITCTAAGRNLIDDATTGAQLTTLGITRGTATLVAGTVVVNTAAVTANSLIFLTGSNGGTTRVGSPHVTARTAATSFTITSVGGVADDYPVSWMLFEP